MKKAEYTVEQVQQLMRTLSEMYDVVRLVDPIECRVLRVREDGGLGAGERCYGVWNSGQRCVNCSSATACHTGCHQEKAESFQDHLFQIQSNPVRVILPDGGQYDAVMELISIRRDAAKAALRRANDRAAEDVGGHAIRYLAVHDSLTGALRSEAFYEQARDLLEQERDSDWMMITADIMDFRLVNSLFGVDKGNEVLRRTAELLRGLADARYGLCGRLSADKFAVLLPRRQYSEAALTKIALELSDDFSSGIYTLCIHFGVYLIQDSTIPVSVMCDRANMALRTIRSDLHTVVAVFDDSIMRRSLAEQEVISAFDEALKQGQFRMYLQPLMRGDGVPFGAEALVRWARPDGSVLSPAAFVGILENAGLIHELDRCIWEQAVRRLSLWKGTDMGYLTISVNMSPKDLYRMDVYSVLTELTDRYGVERGKLRLEITESALLDNPESSYQMIDTLQKAGFLVEIDDFGKGQSSLSLLKDIKADILKIDMEFLRETENTVRSRIILQSIIAMANDLGMQVITEGVETERQLRSLFDMGCSHFQGYYFSRPIPVPDFERKYPAGK